jgi:anti-sigma factor RsiW
MVERQDIDALLISALYGELTPAEETRLAAHLESHPADRTALADLTHARQIVRDSRILQAQVEPPQSVSAMLMQEAARRAPKGMRDQDQHESWFARFVRSFMAHPAMAAAAMLVVVVGVATMVTREKGDHFAESTAPTSQRVADQEQPAAIAGCAMNERTNRANQLSC